MKSFTGQIKLVAGREIQLQPNYCKIKKKFQKYFEGILNILVYQIWVSRTPLPHTISRGTSEDLLENSSFWKHCYRLYNVNNIMGSNISASFSNVESNLVGCCTLLLGE